MYIMQDLPKYTKEREIIIRVKQSLMSRGWEGLIQVLYSELESKEITDIMDLWERLFQREIPWKSKLLLGCSLLGRSERTIGAD